MNQKINLKDRKILFELDKNARQPVSRIAKAVRLKKDTVNYRIKVLEKRGIIKGYYTVINFLKLGYISTRLYIKFTNTTPSIEKEIIDFLIAQPNVFFVAEVEGIFDLSVALIFRDIYQFKEFYDDLKKKYRKYIEEKISIFTKLVEYPRRHLLNRPARSYKMERGAKTRTLSKKDVAVLKLLANNARIPLIELSKKTGIPERTVAYRIKQLEKDQVIVAYRPSLDISKLGYFYYKVDLFLSETKSIERLIRFIERSPYTFYIDHTFGWADLEFDLEVPNVTEIDKIMSQIKEEFPFIKNWIYYRFKRYLKINYFPFLPD